MGDCVDGGGGPRNVELTFKEVLCGSDDGFIATGSMIIFEAGILKLPRLEIGAAEDGRVDGFDDAGGGTNNEESASR